MILKITHRHLRRHLSASAMSASQSLKPSEVVAKLDDFVVGQSDAKRAVAIALRNRWRRHFLPEDFKAEVMPKNILMIGPTGCGKTEIARRLSLLSQAPFIKVEATKFTEVGFHGKDVDHIIKDLVEVAIKLVKKQQADTHKPQAQQQAEQVVLKLFRGPSSADVDAKDDAEWLDALRRGDLDDDEIELEVAIDNPSAQTGKVAQRIMAAILEAQGSGSKAVERKRLPIKEALRVVEAQEMAKLMAGVDMNREAIRLVENDGIVFIDEIDKVCSSKDSFSTSADASAEGVQRDLLPLIEGSTVHTKFGNVVTDHILFIASGAFHTCKPSDMLAELQGRLPIRVTLDGLTEADMYRILTEPINNLIRQQVELMATEGVSLEFEPDALREIARVAVEANSTIENIGARRLHAVLEKIMEEISFEASSKSGSSMKITKEAVQERLEGLLVSQNLSKFVL